MLGKNGVGKTTFIRQLMRSLKHAKQNAYDSASSQLQMPPYHFNPNIQISVQEQQSQLPSISLEDYLISKMAMTKTQLTRMIKTIGLQYHDLTRLLNTFSGGELAKIRLLALNLTEPNFVILDEPTNHLDIETKRLLKQQLQSMNASLLLISHDRQFIETIATRFWVIHQNQLQEMPSAEAAYCLFNAPLNSAMTAAETKKNTKNNSSTESLVFEADGTAILERIIELEAKLEADKKRKPKFQKPDRQRQWQQTIKALYQQLSDNG